MDNVCHFVMITNERFYKFEVFSFIMKKSLIVLALAAMNFSCATFNNRIRQSSGVGKVYSIEQERGFEQISKDCRRSRLEDHWVLSNDSCYDIGYNSKFRSVSFHHSDARKIDLDSNSYAVHSHTFYNDKGRLYNPPSIGDIGVRDVYEMLGFSFGHVGNIDVTGFWIYDWRKRPSTRSDSAKVFFGYKGLCIDFILKQKDEDFNFDLELPIFKKNTLDLGIKIDYRRLKSNDSFIRRKSRKKWGMLPRK